MAHRYILACFVFIFCRVDGESLYGLKGWSVSLEPAIPGNPADILWKHNGNKLVEFNGNEQYVYRTFKNRITLDWHTAEIIITDLRFEDSGNYELEATINNMLYRSSKTLVVIDEVPKPTISCKMNDGSSSNKSGTLQCSAESKDSQTQSLLKFEWESHGNVQPGPQLTISLGDEHDDHEYICNVSNPKSSETATFTAKDCYPDESSSVALAAGLATLFLIIFVVLGTAYSCYRKRKEKINDVEKHSQPGETKGSDQTTAQGDQKKPLLDETTTDQQPDMTKGLHEMTAQGDRNSPLVDETEADQPSEILEKELKKEAEKDGEANVPSDSVSPAKALSPLTQNSPNVAPENAAGEQSEDMDKPISTPEKEPVNEEIDKEKDLYGDTT